VRRSGEVGCVAIRSWERFKGGTRVSFACGGRAVRLLADLGAVVDACVSKLSAQPDQLPAAIARLQDQLAEARRGAKTLNEALLGAEAIARDASAREAGSCRVIVEVFPDRAVEDLQLLAQKYVLSGSRVALLATVETAAGRAALVFGRSDEGLPADLKMGEILSTVCRAHGGKGGGSAAMARGGGVPAAQAAACLEEAFALVAARLHA
jgi:alanyl-tRNA synthetase